MTHDFSPESNGNALQNISEPIQPRDYWKKIFAPQSEEDRNRSLDTLDVPVDGVDGVDGVFKEKPAPKSFPVEAMPKESRELIREAAAAIGCPPEFVAVPMLAALSSAIGNSRVIELKRGWIEGAAIYAAIVADPGEKKTPAAKVALDPAVRKQASLRQDYREELEKYEQDMREYEVQRKDARQEGRAADAPPQPPSMKRTLVEDTTVEALAVVLQGTPRGVLAVRDELAAYVRSMDQYKQGGKGADRQFWLSAWSNTYASVDRKGKAEPIVITRPFASVFGSIQPAVLSEISGGREDGLLDRFLFAYPEPTPSRWSDDEISDEAVCSYRALYGALRDLHMPEGDHGDPEPQRVYLSTEAKEVMIHAINNHREEMEAAGFPARLRGAWSKLEAYLARLTLILTLCRSRAADRVETQDVLSALALLDYFKNHARRVYVGLYGNDPLDLLAADVEKFLKARGGYFKDEPSVLYEKLESRVKPLQAAQLTKDLKDITDSSSRLSLDTGHFRKDGQSRRYVELSLENSVNSVNGVNGVKDAGVDDVQQAPSSDEGVDHSESIEEDTGEVGERGSDNLTSSSVASSVPSGNITEHDASRNGSRPIPDDPPPTRLQPEEIDNLLGPEWVGE